MIAIFLCWCDCRTLYLVCKGSLIELQTQPVGVQFIESECSAQGGLVCACNLSIAEAEVWEYESLSQRQNKTEDC